MKYSTGMLLLCLAIAMSSIAQQQQLWSGQDRKYLHNELTRSRDSLIAVTKNLSEAQWNFKESPERWSINQVVEHLAIWELLLEREITQALRAAPQPEWTKKAAPDSVTVNFLMEEKQHITTDYTQPFTYTVPLGIGKGENNLTWFIKMRNEGIQFVDTTARDLRTYFLRADRSSVHQVFVTIYAHTDRHLRQIRNIQLHAQYPKQ